MLRLRRFRRSKSIRDLISETSISANSLIYPVFVTEGRGKKEQISSLKGQFRYSLDTLEVAARELKEIGLKNILLFGVVGSDQKDNTGSYATKKEQIVSKAVSAIKNVDESFLIFTDVCMCGYTTHGHCGVITNNHNQKAEPCIDNDETINLLADMACAHAEAGADFVAPSAMMDFQVKAIRTALDNNNFKDTGIMSYSAKFLSSFYGPFRDATGNSPKMSDRSTYQLPINSKKQALLEIETDIKEGADIVMVKPAMLYLDIINEASRKFMTPLAAYNVSGEYAIIKSAIDNNLIEEQKAIIELFTAMKRAGADMIISYFSKDAINLL